MIRTKVSGKRVDNGESVIGVLRIEQEDSKFFTVQKLFIKNNKGYFQVDPKTIKEL